MEQGQLHAMLLRNRRQFFLGTILRPVGRHKTGILGRIRVANHHFMFALNMLFIPMHIEQGRHGSGSTVEVFQSFKKRDDTECLLDAGFFL